MNTFLLLELDTPCNSLHYIAVLINGHYVIAFSDTTLSLIKCMPEIMQLLFQLAGVSLRGLWYELNQMPLLMVGSSGIFLVICVL